MKISAAKGNNLLKQHKTSTFGFNETIDFVKIRNILSKRRDRSRRYKNNNKLDLKSSIISK